MSLMSPVPDAPFPESSLNIPGLPSVEWMPLDGLIQSWADFAHETTSAAGLFAASAAFAAFACEGAALASYLEAEDRRSRGDVLSWSPRIQDSRLEALTQLSTARQHWIEIEPWLSRCTLVHDFANGAVPDLVHGLGVHEMYLFRLFLRVLDEAATESGEPLRVLVGHLAVRDCCAVRDLEVAP